MCITFNTAILVKGELCDDRRRIASHYVRGWAPVDLVASIPFSVILRATPGMAHLAEQTRFTRMIKILKFSRLAKVAKVIQMMESLDEWDDDPGAKVYADIKHFTGLITMVLLMAHFAACALAFLAAGDDGWQARTWVSCYFNDCKAMTPGSGADGDRRHVRRGLPSPLRIYTVAVYWAFTTLTTVGDGAATRVL